MEELKQGAQFDSFENFNDALTVLREKFYHPMWVYNSRTVSKANEKGRKAKVPPKPIDDKWQLTML